METFPVLPEANFVCVRMNDAHVILDTGSPVSISRRPLTILGREFAPPTRFHDLHPDHLTELSGFRVDALLGNDVMKHFEVRFRWSERAVDFDAALPEEGPDFPLRTHHRVPIVPLTVEGQDTFGFLDTGAHLGYVIPSYVRDKEPIGEREDYHPSVGRYTTPIHRLRCALAGVAFDLEFGVLPPPLQAQLRPMEDLLGAPMNILGVPILNVFDLTVRYGRGVLTLQPVG